MKHMGHVIKFLLIFRNNSRPHKKYRFEIFGNYIKGTKVERKKWLEKCF